MPKLKRPKLTIVASKVKHKPGKRAAESFYDEDELYRFARKGNLGELNWDKVDWLQACTLPPPTGDWYLQSFSTIYSNPIAGTFHRGNADQAVARILRALRPDIEWRAGIRIVCLEIARWAIISKTRAWERFSSPKRRAEVRAIAKAWREFPVAALPSEMDTPSTVLELTTTAKAGARIAPLPKPLPAKVSGG